MCADFYSDIKVLRISYVQRPLTYFTRDKHISRTADIRIMTFLKVQHVAASEKIAKRDIAL